MYTYIYIYIYVYIYVYICVCVCVLSFSFFRCRVLNTNATQILDTQSFTLLRSSVENKNEVRFKVVWLGYKNNAITSRFY